MHGQQNIKKNQMYIRWNYKRNTTKVFISLCLYQICRGNNISYRSRRNVSGAEKKSVQYSHYTVTTVRLRTTITVL